ADRSALLSSPAAAEGGGGDARLDPGGSPSAAATPAEALRAALHGDERRPRPGARRCLSLRSARDARRGRLPAGVRLDRPVPGPPRVVPGDVLDSPSGCERPSGAADLGGARQAAPAGAGASGPRGPAGRAAGGDRGRRTLASGGAARRV